MLSQRVGHYRDVEAAVMERGKNKRLAIGPRGEMVALRCHSLTPDALHCLLTQWKATKVFPSPYNRCLRTDLLHVIAGIGVNVPVHLGRIREGLEALLRARKRKGGASAWSHFEKRTQKVNPSKRIFQALRMFRRLCRGGGYHPYGRRLEQMGCCMDLFVVKKVISGEEVREYYARLNTYSTNPVILYLGSKSEIPAVDRKGVTLGPRS